MRLNGKSVVVTGASSGMGKAIVELFANEGANVIAVARRKERLDALAESLKDAPGKVLPFAGDISKEETMTEAIDKAVSEFGRLDVLINNAGVMDDMSPVGDIKNEKIEQVFAVNVFGPMYAMRKAVQVFLAQGTGGNIINVASVGAAKTAAGAVYGDSKAAVVSLTKNTAFMYIPDGIRCNAIAQAESQQKLQHPWECLIWQVTDAYRKSSQQLQNLELHSRLQTLHSSLQVTSPVT